MPVMGVWEVRMTVRQWLVAVWVTMLDAGQRPFVIRVLVVGIVTVLMLMFHRLVRVGVAVLLGEMQPDAQRHQGGGNQQSSADRLTQEGNG